MSPPNLEERYPEPPAWTLPVPAQETVAEMEVYSRAVKTPAVRAAPAGSFPVPVLPAEPLRPERKQASSPAGLSAGPRVSPGDTAKTAEARPASTPAAVATDKPVSSVAGAARPALTPVATDPGRAAPAAQERRREVLARRGDSVVIDLEGRGWLFLGLPEKQGSQGVSFQGAEPGERKSSFTFKAQEYGDYDLAFQLQDNSRGAFQSEVVRLRVLPDEQFHEQLSQRTARPDGEAADSARYEKAEKLFAVSEYALALPEYLKVYRENDPLLNDRLAMIYAENGESEAAAKFFQKNISAPGGFADKAVLGLIRAGLALGDPELVMENLGAMLAQRSLPIERELLAVARFQIAQKRFYLAFELLQEYLQRYPQGPQLDGTLFQLGQLYELDSPLRDFKKAREYYEKVYDGFPESRHAAEARSRIFYLDRYFFHVY